MTTVTLTKTAAEMIGMHTTYQLGDHDDQSSSRVTVASWHLPAGYWIGETVMGEAAIFSADNQYCEITEHTSGRPQLITSAREMPVLEVAE